MAPDWNFAELVEAVARTVPDGIAVVEGDGRRVTWSELDSRADHIAAALLQAGLPRQAKVAVFMRNSSAFLEAYYGAFKAALVPVNVNYRYGRAETIQLLDDAGAAAVIYHAEFRPVMESVRSAHPGRVRIWIEVPDSTVGGPPRWASGYTEIINAGPRRPDVARRGDDIMLLYTGGTTGLPKGVLWRQADLFNVMLAQGNPFRDIPVPESVEQLTAAIRRPGPVDLAACPYMHATGLFNQLMTMVAGGTSVVMPGTSFDPVTLLDTADRERATLLVIVGDAMARPIADALAADPARWQLTRLRAIVSSGATFSRVTKERLLDLLPEITIVDAFGSSEASGMGVNISRRGDVADTAEFRMGTNARLLRTDGTFVEPGAPGEGLVALTGTLPLGYHNDPDKTAATFRIIDGVRYSIPGDLARVDGDGRLHLLGRGSSSINSGGEKIYPEEVEEVIRRLPTVADAACIGVPDDRFGQAVAAVVEPRAGAQLELDELRRFVKQHLAGYKAPRRLVLVDTLLRSPSGKLDHRWLREVVDRSIGQATGTRTD